MNSSIELYAELLRNINSINVFVCLDSSSASEASAFISQDGFDFVLHYAAHTYVLRLPARVTPQDRNRKCIPHVTSSIELGFRLSVERSYQSSRESLENISASTPWSAPALEELECIHCRNCRRNIVRPSTVKTWKDLPSENWAEMMEFWHCHKPNIATPRDMSSSKGYAASNRISAEPSVGFVDTCTFLLSYQDCNSLKVANTSNVEPPSSNLICIGCDETLGYVDQKTRGWRLLKSALAAGIHPRSVFLQQYPTEKWISALLLSAIEVQASKKFIVHNGTKGGKMLLIWIFASDLRISYLTGGKTSTARVMKLFWKPYNSSNSDQGPAYLSNENVELPLTHYFQMLETALIQNKSILPPSARKYQDWDVSLLRSFSHEDIDDDARL